MEKLLVQCPMADSSPLRLVEDSLPQYLVEDLLPQVPAEDLLLAEGLLLQVLTEGPVGAIPALHREMLVSSSPVVV